MQIALIKPIPLLKQIPDEYPYHLILNSLVLESPAYREHYAERIEAGDKVILDNDAWEARSAASLDNLLLGAELLQRAGATQGFEMVIPDVLHDGAQTIERALEAIQHPQFISNPGGFMFVPQGRTAFEWFRCLKSFIIATALCEQLQKTCIGIPRCAEKLEGGIPHAVRVAHMIALGLPLHLLGWGEDTAQWAGLGRYEWIRGIDSAKPISLGLQGKQINARYIRGSRPENYFDITHVGPTTSVTIAYNVQVMKALLHSAPETAVPFGAYNEL